MGVVQKVVEGVVEEFQALEREEVDWVTSWVRESIGQQGWHWHWLLCKGLWRIGTGVSNIRHS